MTLVLENVVRQVGAETHLYGIDLTLEAGSLNVILGPTLAGKTTLLRLMAGLDRSTSGRILVDGRDVTNVSVRKRSVAMVYQQFVNYPSFTIYDNIASPLKIGGGLSREQIDEKVRRVARMMHIDHLLDRLPAELSGGQQQRTAIARALVKEADLLLLDEPLVNLDYKLREELRAEMVEIFSAGRTTVVYTTTEPVEALMLGGNIAVMDAGRLVQSGPTLEVYHNPADVRVGEVFSDPPMNRMPAEITRAGGQAVARISADLSIPLGEHMRMLAPGRYQLGVRANHLALRPKSHTDIGIPATVEMSEISGSETFIHARHADVTVVIQEEGVHTHTLGEAVTLYVDPRRLFAFDASGRLAAAPDRNAQRRQGAA